MLMGVARWCRVHAGETLGPGLLLQILCDTELTKEDLL